ncbi:MAG: short chain dehydrogenase [Acidobacteriota bacterium]|jgi:NAD(P)-dependent dehydrogenase (short-subunit alcohol dehydrogenase family)|nr:MAG: short chain dehydrogenase [Acidobacteriota bacterium]
MRIIVIGATGTIGRAVVDALSPRHDVVAASRSSNPSVDIADAASIRALFASVGHVDAVVCAAGAARFAPLAELTDDDFAFSIANKLMGQVNVIRQALAHVNDGGSITVTSGVLGQQPAPGSGAISLVNAALEGFARAAALEAPRGIRVNVVSPPWIAETLAKLGRPSDGALTAAACAKSYVQSVEGSETGVVYRP